MELFSEGGGKTGDQALGRGKGRSLMASKLRSDSDPLGTLAGLYPLSGPHFLIYTVRGL